MEILHSWKLGFCSCVFCHSISASCFQAQPTCHPVWLTTLRALSTVTSAWPLGRPVNTSGPSRLSATLQPAVIRPTSLQEQHQQALGPPRSPLAELLYWRGNYRVQTAANTNIVHMLNICEVVFSLPGIWLGKTDLCRTARICWLVHQSAIIYLIKWSF